MADLLALTPTLYRLRIPGERAHLLNCYLRLDADGVTLIDTGWPDSAALIADALAALQRRPADVKRIVLTHFHEDHCGAAAEIAGWSGAEVIAGEPDSSYITGDDAGPIPVLTDAERTLRPDFDAAPHGPACRVDRTVTDGDVLDLGGGARVIAVPGHTPGSIALYLPDDDAVLTGDAVAEVNGQVAVGVFNTDRPAAVRAVTTLAATGARIAGFGHGEAIIGDAAAHIAAAVDLFG
ncbi:MBL fold metallo-hydrolase [Mycobacterium sp. SMC-16]|uniref:MBL fold metallo-hydrolase n=1 Tax=Mycobacterium sp. SMC-16 TaxID=3385967 RepID=UPI00390CD220